MVQAVYTGCLLIIAITGLMGWRIGRRWTGACGVTERAGLWSLACVLPTAGLILAVHILALASLFCDKGLVTLQAVTVVFALLAALCHRFLPRDRSEQCTVDAEDPTDSNPWASLLGVWWIPLLVVGGMYLVFAVDAVTRYPTGYDAVSYQLPMAINWARERALNLVVGHSGYCWPANGMIVASLLVFAEFEWLLPLVHLPKALLLGLVMFALARAVGVSWRGALLSACIALSVPMVVFQGFSGYVDVYAASAWLSALLAVVWATRVQSQRGRYGLLIMAGLSAGVALGSKVTFVALVAVLAMVVLAMHWLRPRAGARILSRTHPLRESLPVARREGGPRRDSRSSVTQVALFSMGVLVCSGFWFIRGAVQAGNPVYPLVIEWPADGFIPSVGVATQAGVFPERSWSRKLRHWWSYPWREAKYNEGYNYGVDAGLGAAFATFVPLGFFWTVVAGLKRGRRNGQEQWRMMLTFLALLGAAMLLTVFHETIRFVLPLILVAIPVAAVSVDRLIARFPRYTAVLLTLSLTTTAAVATLKPVHSLLGRVRDHNFQRGWFYQVPPLIDEFEPGARVLNLSTEPMNYALFGSKLANVVIAPLHWAVLSEGGTVSAAALREHHIDYVFVREPWPDDWPDNLPVELIYDDTKSRALPTTPATRIFRVMGPRMASSGMG
ncbi:MAG: hypothetical protein V3W34_02245 [Phycisphaerae bacterium]